MDKAPFSLSYERKKNGEAIPPSSKHITSKACIGIDTAPVPPVIIYKGACLPENWTTVTVTSDSGWTNSHIMIKWLEDVFDPYTRDLAQGRQHLLFLDGGGSSYQSGLTSLKLVGLVIFILKARYFDRLKTYQFGAADSSAAKGMFWAWHQQAWRETATSRQMRGAWRKAGTMAIGF
ncbi:hypothetical protein TREMEDRAFT_66501 [Tremella mesenterica DSM 1558]|uniref:uncharacterized protein n=1 Tax=Tremella mesenterica (strain ATCC 24925 / CBS 8224 / DSM 1558 / NBRC 9311 / NRRL Y-6157 / RJB 2259-6 / UBC 559-6) TaxID=578456 RepID=UPI00032C33DC|nr:uncharacterized protein TREMEDRAFT_66501 [Tremella mesenterica DSM 1558]EIW65510.1 hypothetical protein TREMEDRAFT_66501 [Tremella mesenterica DSM 1558]